MSSPESPRSEDVVTLMIVPGTAGSIRRFHVPRIWLKRAGLAVAAASVALLVLSVDYVRVRVSLSELERRRWRRSPRGSRRSTVSSASFA